MKRLYHCLECQNEQWLDGENCYACTDCGADDMVVVANDRCNGCGRELWGRQEHECGLCEGCQGE